jgi:hypothetical protein
MAEVDRDDLVVAAAARIGVDVLAVGRDDHQHHRGDDQADLPGEGVGREPGDAQGQEDLVRCVGHRGQRVTGEHRQRDPLRQQGLAQPVAAHRPADEQPFDRVRHRWHKAAC